MTLPVLLTYHFSGLPPHLFAVDEVSGPDSEELLSRQASDDNLVCWTQGHGVIVHVHHELELQSRTDPPTILQLNIKPGATL